MTAPLPERVRECECSCHGSDKYLGYHFEPCCRECSLCRKRIPWGRRVSHAENCTAATITALRAENARLTSEVERLKVELETNAAPGMRKLDDIAGRMGERIAPLVAVVNAARELRSHWERDGWMAAYWAVNDALTALDAAGKETLK